jgi:hypothetical protein
MRLNMLVVLVFGAAAVSAPGQDAHSPEVEDCNVEVVVAGDTPWRLVRAKGFTFCVPPDWKPSGKRSRAGVDPSLWRGEGGTMKWGAGKWLETQFTVTMMPVSSGGGPRPSTNEYPPPPTASSAEIRRLSEITGGEVDQMLSGRRNNKYHTAVNWSAPARVYLVGEASTRAVTDMYLEIYRTVRFTGR